MKSSFGQHDMILIKDNKWIAGWNTLLIQAAQDYLKNNKNIK
jgi:hypothetical protein